MRSKYHNIWTNIDGYRFASKKEAHRYLELKLLEKASQVTNLSIQPRFILQCAFTDNTGIKQRPIEYVADFAYYDKHTKTDVVEDVKGVKTDVYKLKKKLFLYAYQDLDFREI